MTAIPDAVLYGELGEALHVFIERLGTDLMDDTWHSMNCSEVEAIAEVMRLGGAVIGEATEGERAARMVIAQHYDSDEYGDAHYMGDGQRVRHAPAALRSSPFGRLGVVVDDDKTGIVTVRWEDNGAVENMHVSDLVAVYPEGED